MAKKPEAPTGFIAELQIYLEELEDEKTSLEEAQEEKETDARASKIDELETEISEVEGLLDTLGAW